jgi:Na+-translocating ferredoxin:NAD+ oxidoreductase subunit D
MLFVATASGVVFEWLYHARVNRQGSIKNGSAFLLCALLAFLLPPSTPSAVVALGAFLAVIVTKEFLGGLGENSFHPSLVAYAALFAFFPEVVATPEAFGGISYASSSFPLSADLLRVQAIPPWLLLFGQTSNTMGGVSYLAVFISGAILLSRKWIYWELPLSFLIVMFTGSVLLGGALSGDVFSPIVFFTAFFILTDTVTTPITRTARSLFAIGAAVLTLAFQLLTGHFVISMACAILILNAASPTLASSLRRLRTNAPTA